MSSFFPPKRVIATHTLLHYYIKVNIIMIWNNIEHCTSYLYIHLISDRYRYDYINRLTETVYKFKEVLMKHLIE